VTTPPDDGRGAEELPTHEAEEADPLAAARDAVARARRGARERGFRPGEAARSAGQGRGLHERRSPTGQGGRDPQALGDELDRLMSTRGWEADLQVGSVVGRWPAIVGDQVAAHVTPVAFEGTVLTVQADSTAWATQMRLLVSSVLTRITAEVGAEVVTSIVVKAPGGPSWRKGPLRSQGPGPRDTYG
jgi:predicted nucleic acid-binding Zn ribbon protein